MRRAGLVDHRDRLLVTLHGLRKTGGSIALSRGVPLIIVQHQMGHSRETTTAAHYAFMLSGQELDRIGNVFAALDDERSDGKLPAAPSAQGNGAAEVSDRAAPIR